MRVSCGKVVLVLIVLLLSVFGGANVMTDDILREVKQDEIPKILEVLKKDWPENFLLHQYVSNMDKFKKEENKLINQTLYRHGTIDDGIFILKTALPGCINEDKNFFIGSTCSDTSDLSAVLMNTSVIPFTKGLLFEVNLSKFTPSVTQAVTSKGLKFKLSNNILVWLPPDSDLDVGVLPDDVCLKYLEECHIQEINENWLNKYPGSDLLLDQELKINFGLGLFRKSDSQLLSSSLCFHSGGIFILHTHAEHRKKGYAEVIVRNMAHEIRTRGRVPFATIVVNNTPSLSLFKKIGFTEFSSVNFISLKTVC